MVIGRDLALLPSFAAVVRLGSFTAAARELRLTKSVVSDHVRLLEERHGVRLLERTTRRLRLTQVGEQVLVAVTAVLAAAGEIEGIVDGHRAAPTGTLRVTAPADLANTILVPACGELARVYPALRFEILSTDEPRDLVRDGIDLGLRLGLMRERGVIARKLSTEPEVIVAADGRAGRLAERLAGVTRPGQLGDVPWLGHSRLALGPQWTFRAADGSTDSVTVTPRAVSDSMQGVIELMFAGVGIAVLPLHAVARDLEAGRVLRLCDGWIRRQLTLYAILPTRKPPPRARLLLASLPAALTAHGFAPLPTAR